jgi:hypothetical protein
METDFRKVLKDLRAEEKRLDTELSTIRAMIPGAELMASRMPISREPERMIFNTMGTKDAIIALLATQTSPVVSGDIVKELINGGIRTTSSDFSSSVGSTLYQLKKDGAIEKLEDGWRLKRQVEQVRLIPRNQDGPSYLEATGQTLPSSQ